MDCVDRTDIHEFDLVGIVDDGINNNVLLLEAFSKTSEDRGGGLKIPDALASDPRAVPGLVGLEGAGVSDRGLQGVH